MATVKRRTVSEVTIQSAGNGLVATVCTENANRVYLLIGVTQVGQPVYYSTRPSLTTTNSLLLSATTLSQFQVEFSRDKSPLLVTQAFYVMSPSVPTGGIVVVIEELEYEVEVLDRSPEDGLLQLDDTNGIAPTGEVLGPDAMHQQLSDLVRVRRKLAECGQCRP